MVMLGNRTAAEDALLLFTAIFKDTKIEMLMLSFNALIKAIGNCLRREAGSLLNSKDFESKTK